MTVKELIEWLEDVDDKERSILIYDGEVDSFFDLEVSKLATGTCIFEPRFVDLKGLTYHRKVKQNG